jgi:hypothetical protein
MGVTTKLVPVESHNFIGMVKCYHGPLRRAYQIITTKIPEISKEMALQMVFKAINNTASLKGLIPTLLVFRAYPQMVKLDILLSLIIQRAAAIKKAIIEI